MTKKDIALHQLRGAAKHFKNKDYICSITLSSAAEEILGRMAKRRKGVNQLDIDIAYAKSLGEYLKRTNSFIKLLDEKTIVGNRNKIKNELKHNHLGRNVIVETDYEFEAVMFFVKAIKNYFAAFGEFPKDRIVMPLFEHLTL